MTSFRSLITVGICLGTALFSVSASAEVLHCGLKTVTVNGGKIQKIRHEDGTVHTGDSVSRNWTFDGKSIKHRFHDKSIQCSTGKAPDRKTIISQLAARFADDPSLYGLSKAEGSQMKDYTTRLMTEKNECHLLIDAAKSTGRAGMYYVDCNDQKGKSHRFWISRDDLKSQTSRSASKPMDRSGALRLCDSELNSRATNRSTYDSSLIFGSSVNTIPETGRNVVSINFSAQNSFGVEQKLRGKCIIESGIPIEVTVEER
jgi:hypothetical protein